MELLREPPRKLLQQRVTTRQLLMSKQDSLREQTRKSQRILNSGSATRHPKKKRSPIRSSQKATRLRPKSQGCILCIHRDTRLHQMLISPRPLRCCRLALEHQDCRRLLRIRIPRL